MTKGLGCFVIEIFFSKYLDDKFVINKIEIIKLVATETKIKRKYVKDIISVPYHYPRPS